MGLGMARLLTCSPAHLSRRFAAGHRTTEGTGRIKALGTGHRGRHPWACPPAHLFPLSALRRPWTTGHLLARTGSGDSIARKPARASVGQMMECSRIGRDGGEPCSVVLTPWRIKPVRGGGLRAKYVAGLGATASTLPKRSEP